MAADVRNYGACLDGVSDDTQAFNDALAESDTVIFPKGRARVTDQILIPNNKQLIGEGVKQSVFAIGLDFNKSALGVVKMGTSENMGLIDKIGFEFEQPVSSLRSDMIQYPPAIYHRGIPRVRIGHVRFSRAWDGIDAGLNAGGATYDFIECGALHKGLLIDGALDTMNIGRFRVWPFGMSQNSDIGLVYRDGETIGAEIGKCDGLEGSIQCFAASVVFNINGGGSAGRHLSALHLDGDKATLTVRAGVLNIDYLYTTKSAAQSDKHNILLDGDDPYVVISSIDLRSSDPRQPILVNDGTLAINGGRIDSRALDKAAALIQGGSLIIRNTELTAFGARSAPYVEANVTGPVVVTQNCYFLRNAGSGVGIRIPASQAGNQTGNIYCGRSIVTF